MIEVLDGAVKHWSRLREIEADRAGAEHAGAEAAARALERGGLNTLGGKPGGSFGDPFARDPALVVNNVLDGLLSPAQAREEDGLVGGPPRLARTDRRGHAGSGECVPDAARSRVTESANGRTVCPGIA